ncbi:MAG: A/G-specific adenine glycosylase [Patescibacteria group bacterium]
MKNPTSLQVKNFQKAIWAYYKKHRRSFPWRENITEYNVAISEIMLQQTQAPRVVSKYLSFIKKFPSWKSLAQAPLHDVLAEWKGLGYNRRALNLQKLAKIVTNDLKGKLPQTPTALIELPSIGPNTAGSIMAFAWNIPHPFIETNIRSVYIHFFFNKSKAKIHDKEILKIVEITLDRKNAREWYYALMDYGVMLKAQMKLESKLDPSRKSKHYTKQKSFKNSNREVRSLILSTLLKGPATQQKIIDAVILAKSIYRTEENIIKNLLTLEKEGFIQRKKQDQMNDPAFEISSSEA